MIAANPIGLLLRAVPEWFSSISHSLKMIEGHADVPVANGVGRTVADIRIADDLGKVTVSETVVGTVFPASCPERHIEASGTFCIGYKAGLAVGNFDEAVVWWGLLKQFMLLQRVASRTRRWPARQAIAHGDAGPHHLLAIEAASELGLKEDYFRMLDGEPTWFAEKYPKLAQDSDRLLNGRLPCPKGCLRKGQPILRSDCQKTEVICRLLREERLRRKKEQEFWSDQRLRGAICCGTMDGCPLAK